MGRGLREQFAVQLRTHEFFKGASYALMFGLLAWSVLGATLYEALKLF